MVPVFVVTTEGERERERERERDRHVEQPQETHTHTHTRERERGFWDAVTRAGPPLLMYVVWEDAWSGVH